MHVFWNVKCGGVISMFKFKNIDDGIDRQILLISSSF
jgi:hypothetical protein